MTRGPGTTPDAYRAAMQRVADHRTAIHQGAERAYRLHLRMVIARAEGEIIDDTTDFAAWSNRSAKFLRACGIERI